MKENLWLTVVTYLTYGIDKEVQKAIEYLKEQVRVLKEEPKKDKHILLENGYEPTDRCPAPAQGACAACCTVVLITWSDCGHHSPGRGSCGVG